jgi:glutamate N-acetyltransferase/amino-acid N-acetyltransferase
VKEEEFSVPGFLAAGISAGIKSNGKPDLALIFSKRPAKVAGVFTKNSFRAAPVQISEERVKGGIAQAIVTNSGNANACTGERGKADARAIAEKLARELKIDERMILIASTGVIGHPLPVSIIERRLPDLVRDLSPSGLMRAELAMMTTDRWPKIAYRKLLIGGKEVTMCGLAKGAGMIQPQMATMLAYILTDLNIGEKELHSLFRYAVDRSFNSISVDGCMSTNDMVVIMANGIAGNKPPALNSRDYRLLGASFLSLMEGLAKEIVRDGEGATKVLEIVVEGAATVQEAKKVAYAVGNANLVKAAFFGQDPNWGRIISAVGSLGLPLEGEKVRLYLEDECIFASGMGQIQREERLREIMESNEIRVGIYLGRGQKSWRIFASDLTFDYVRINSHYRT